MYLYLDLMFTWDHYHDITEILFLYIWKLAHSVLMCNKKKKPRIKESCREIIVKAFLNWEQALFIAVIFFISSIICIEIVKKYVQGNKSVFSWNSWLKGIFFSESLKIYMVLVCPWHHLSVNTMTSMNFYSSWPIPLKF